MNFDFICFKNTALATTSHICSMIIILACQYAALAIVVENLQPKFAEALLEISPC